MIMMMRDSDHHFEYCSTREFLFEYRYMYMLIERGLHHHFRSKYRHNPSRADIALITNRDSTQLSGPMLSGASHAIIPIS